MKRKTDNWYAFAAALLVLLVVVAGCLCVLRSEVNALWAYAQETRIEKTALLVLPEQPDDPVETYAAPVEAQPLTPVDEGTLYVLRVLTAEAGHDATLCRCVAQALYNTCERYDWTYTPAEMMQEYSYAEPLEWYSEEAEQAYDEVFCSGVRYTDIGDATMFYNPYCFGESVDHESQCFVCEIHGVRFFTERRWQNG